MNPANTSEEKISGATTSTMNTVEIATIVNRAQLKAKPELTGGMDGTGREKRREAAKRRDAKSVDAKTSDVDDKKTLWTGQGGMSPMKRPSLL